MTLQEFLLTADANHNVALQQARNYTENQPVFITSNTMTVYVLQAGLYDVFSDEAANVNSPVRGICMALMDRLRGQSEFNLSTSLPLGQANIAMLDILISALPQHEPAISDLKATLLAVSNKPFNPFANVSLHDVLIARDSCPAKSVTAQGGFVTITTTAACEKHNPRLMALNPRTNKWQRVNSFYDVADAGVYDAAVPPQFNGLELAVDDAYGVL